MATTAEATFLQWRISGGLARRRSPDILKAIERALLRAGRETIPVIQTFTPVFRGFLKQSYQVNLLLRPRRMQVTSTSPPGKIGAMEEGRRAGMPPVLPLIAWVKKAFGVRGKKATSAAWAVATKMKSNGIVVPLKVSNLGGMFRRSLKLLGARFYSTRVKIELDLLK